MNEVIRKIVRVADLPEHLRAGLDPSRPVEIVQHGADDMPAPASPAAEMEARGQRAKEWLETLRAARRDSPSVFNSMDDIVAYVRAVRDGGDLSKWLGDPPTSTPTR